jgi:hypothetical protein
MLKADASYATHDVLKGQEATHDILKGQEALFSQGLPAANHSSI